MFDSFERELLGPLAIQKTHRENYWESKLLCGTTCILLNGCTFP